MIERPVIGSTTLLTIVISMKGILTIPLLSSQCRYRSANKSQVIWRCYKSNCASRLRFDGIEYVKVTDHDHARNPEEIILMEFKSIINTGTTTSHYPPRLIIHEALVYINKNDGTAVLNYPSTQRIIERKRKQQDKPLPTPTSVIFLLLTNLE